jgi:hypothetical protein
MLIRDVGSGAGDVVIPLAGLLGPKEEIVGTAPALSAIEAQKGASKRPRWRTRRVAFDAVVGRYPKVPFRTTPTLHLLSTASKKRAFSPQGPALGGRARCESNVA